MELRKNFNNTNSEILLSQAFETVEMKISKEDSAHVMQRLTHLYVYPVAATIREIVSNAIDTTIKSGTDKAIELTLPTELSNEFRVQDFGEGMSREFLETKFTQYGFSTKSEDLTQTGAYGLGSKSPLAYCSQFTVVSVKDNMKTEMLVSSESEGNFAHIIDEFEVNEPNGTTIIIPTRVEDRELFIKYSMFYHNYSFKNNIKIVNSLEAPIELMEVGKIELFEGVHLPVYLQKNNDNIALALTKSLSEEDIDYSLSGWFYKGNLDQGENPKVLVDLVPGVFEFSSSRDEIKRGDRFNKVHGMIEEKVNELLVEYVSEYIHSLNDQEKVNLFSNTLFNTSLYEKMFNSLSYPLIKNLELSDGRKVLSVLNGDNAPFTFDFGFRMRRKADGNFRYLKPSVFDLGFKAPNNDEVTPFSTTTFDETSKASLYPSIAKIKETVLNEKQKINSSLLFLNTSKDSKMFVISDLPENKTEMVKIFNRLKKFREDEVFIYNGLTLLGTYLTKEEILAYYEPYALTKRNLTVLSYEEFMQEYKTVVYRSSEPRAKSVKKEKDISKISLNLKEFKTDNIISILGKYTSNYYNYLSEVVISEIEQDKDTFNVLIVVDNKEDYDQNIHWKAPLGLLHNLNTLSKKENIRVYTTYSSMLTKANYKEFVDKMDYILVKESTLFRSNEIKEFLLSSDKFLDFETSWDNLDIKLPSNNLANLLNFFPKINLYQSNVSSSSIINYLEDYNNQKGVNSSVSMIIDLFSDIPSSYKVLLEHVTFSDDELTNDFLKSKEIIAFLLVEKVAIYEIYPSDNLYGDNKTEFTEKLQELYLGKITDLLK